jgi:hypothetical protein
LSALRTALSTLPRTLDETYARILRSLESTGQLQDAVTALQWLCYSTRPLQLLELREVLAIVNGDDGGFFSEERLPDPADIMVVCSSLISCNAIDDDGDDPNGGTSTDSDTGSDSIETVRTIEIRLAHLSVKEYLLSDRCVLQSDFQSQTCNMVMAESCLRYLLHLCEKAPLTEEVVDQHPLAWYAAEYWWQHAQKIDSTPGCTVFNLASRLFTNGNAALLSWLQLHNVDRPGGVLDLSLTGYDLCQPLYYAALIGVSEVVRNILREAIDANAQGGRYGNALQAASQKGHEKVVQMLLNGGANVNAQGGEFANALQAASYKGHGKVVQMLVDARANVNAQGGEYGNALQAASYKGHGTVVRMLLDAGANVNAEGGEYGTALQAASQMGHEKVVQMLLDIKANVKTQGGLYNNALQALSSFSPAKIAALYIAI